MLKSHIKDTNQIRANVEQTAQVNAQRMGRQTEARLDDLLKKIQVCDRAKLNCAGWQQAFHRPEKPQYPLCHVAAITCTRTYPATIVG